MWVTVFERPTYSDNEYCRILPEDGCFTSLARHVRVHVEDIFCMKEPDLVREAGIFARLQLRIELLGVRLGPFQNLPNPSHSVLQIVQVALLSCDRLLPVPLVHVHAVVMVEEVVLSHGTHICANTFANVHSELLQRHPFPFCGSLYDLGIDWVLVVVV